MSQGSPTLVGIKDRGLQSASAKADDPEWRLKPALHSKLKSTLDQLCENYNHEFENSPQQFFATRRDPIFFPHQYHSFEDIEAAGFLAATFAYGRVASLCKFVDSLLKLLQPSPFAFLRQGPAAVQRLAAHKPYYRLQKSREILALLTVLSRIYAEGKSLYQMFLPLYLDHREMKPALIQFVERLRELSTENLKFLLPSPHDGSPCKRLNLFLRWMVRRNGIDFGIWGDVSAAHLIMPLDTHIGRVAYRLHWIDTPSLSWRKAEQITNALRRFDPLDPTRYDFALCHESISKSEWLRNRLF